MENTCIICGAEIPEGRQVCTGCEIKSHADLEADLKAAHEEIGRLRAENARLKTERNVHYEACQKEAGLTPDCTPYWCVKTLKAENAELKARLDKLNGAIANMPKERLEEICKLYDLFINKKCYKYFAISNTENRKEIDEVIFKDIKIDGVRTCIIGYPENGCQGYWHTLKDMGIKYFVGENAKKQAEARLKELTEGKQW